MADVDPRIPAPVPAHVPPALVVDFDLWNIPGSDEDAQLAMRAVQQASPDVFWTPRNGGHWVVTRAEDIDVLQRDVSRFSNECYVVPKKPPEIPKELPLECDPPRHTALRRPLTAALLPRQVMMLEERIRALTIELIDKVYARGQCEFVAEIAKALPIFIFLDLVDLPRADAPKLLPIADQVVHGATPEDRAAGFVRMQDYLGQYIRARRETPGDDLLSTMVNIQDGDYRISEADALSYASLVLFGGLDTVAAMLGFVARYLTRDEMVRRAIAARLDDDEFMRSAVEELLRRHGIANTARMVIDDIDYKGAPMKAGEMVLVMHALAGMDERLIANPETLDLSRTPLHTHAIFSNGPHTCPGAVLARRELKIFLQEWLRRIPDYTVTPGTVPRTTTGLVSGFLEMHLCWPVF
jgi:cytochrome P450